MQGLTLVWAFTARRASTWGTCRGVSHLQDVGFHTNDKTLRTNDDMSSKLINVTAILGGYAQ